MVSSWREMPRCLAHQKFLSYILTYIPFCVSGLLASFLNMENFYGDGLFSLKLQTERSHQPETSLKITLLHRFLSFIMTLIVPNRAIHYISFDKTWVSILYLYFPRLSQSCGFKDIFIQYLRSLPCCWLVQFITCLYKIFKVIGCLNTLKIKMHITFICNFIYFCHRDIFPALFIS